MFLHRKGLLLVYISALVPHPYILSAQAITREERGRMFERMRSDFSGFCFGSSGEPKISSGISKKCTHNARRGFRNASRTRRVRGEF